ncbi:hypothetical protein [Deinococcus sp. Marseille-Q6407]|uniref:hypothetical protein n=1 Tax=Deinococcus sp. Marseille-Q6407 TaxID=2969223 RepID=UPI0021C1212A|nr:hypothetical protein [Deinococcus sp. Marseille-Q6407]
MRRLLTLLAALALPLASAQATAAPTKAAPAETAQAVPLPHWALATPLQWQRTGRVGEPAEVQLRFAAPPEVTVSFPCTLSEPPSVKVTRLRDSGEEEPLWLTLTPVWDAPTCQGGVLVLPGGTRGQYRAELYGLPAGEYRLTGFWFGGRAGDTLGAPEQRLRLE